MQRWVRTMVKPAPRRPNYNIEAELKMEFQNRFLVWGWMMCRCFRWTVVWCRRGREEDKIERECVLFSLEMVIKQEGA